MNSHKQNKADPTISAGKWIEGLDPRMGVTEAACIVLETRLRAASSRFELARERAGEDPDDLRKARVATRRARSAIDAFRSYLPKKASKRLRRRLKSMRRLAGEPRSAWIERDAMCGRLDGPEDRSRIAVSFAAGCLDAWRRDSLERLRTGGNEIDLAGYEQDARKCLKRLADRADDVSLGEHAEPSIRGVEARIARASSGGLDDLDSLHQFRIDVKRLRYTYEIFRCCIPDERFDRIYPSAEAVQDRLGEMNDLHELVCRLHDFAGADDLPPPIERSMVTLVARLESEREAAVLSFLAWWGDAESCAPSALRSLGVEPVTASDGSRTLRVGGFERSIDNALRVASERTRDTESTP